MILTSEILTRHAGISFAFSTRRGGVSPEPFGMNTGDRVGDDPEKVLENRSRLFRHLGIRNEDVAVPRQCHSTEIKVVEGGGAFERTDGLITAVPNVWLSVSVADCVPVFMVDMERRVVSAVHAGWRGSAGRIVEQAVNTMRNVFGTNPGALVAFVGPSAGKCCYEVGPEVAGQFSRSVIEDRSGKTYLDLKGENVSQLRAAGVRQENVETSEHCTICTPDLFHSYRRDKERSGRMMGIIGMQGKL